mmetsp:Transcript_8779/g.25081  ORF Transcript_8779/g.25081 Transcript_8779/m.25081 type:complete len:228 (-) Transcript_8779:470-1153(-)
MTSSDFITLEASAWSTSDNASSSAFASSRLFMTSGSSESSSSEDSSWGGSSSSCGGSSAVRKVASPSRGVLVNPISMGNPSFTSNASNSIERSISFSRKDRSFLASEQAFVRHSWTASGTLRHPNTCEALRKSFAESFLQTGPSTMALSVASSSEAIVPPEGVPPPSDASTTQAEPFTTTYIFSCFLPTTHASLSRGARPRQARPQSSRCIKQSRASQKGISRPICV